MFVRFFLLLLEMGISWQCFILSVLGLAHYTRVEKSRIFLKDDLGVKRCNFRPCLQSQLLTIWTAYWTFAFWSTWRSWDIATKQLWCFRLVQSISEEITRKAGWDRAVCCAGSVNMTTTLLQNGHKVCVVSMWNLALYGIWSQIF